MKTKLLLFLFRIATIVGTVKITNVKIPSTYTVENSKSNGGLLLDCEYECYFNETGFVLKWLFNDIPIYQWIPSRTPSALANMRGKIDISYVASQEKHYKHRAILIPNPTWNMTGRYECDLQTFQSNDKRSGNVQIIGM